MRYSPVLCSPGTTRLEDICRHVEDEDLSYCLSIAQRIAGSPFNLAGLQNRECRWVNISSVMILLIKSVYQIHETFSNDLSSFFSSLYDCVWRRLNTLCGHRRASDFTHLQIQEHTATRFLKDGQCTLDRGKFTLYRVFLKFVTEKFLTDTITSMR